MKSRIAVLLLALFVLALSAQTVAHVSGSDLVRVDTMDEPFSEVWINLRHLHSIDHCYHPYHLPPGNPALACMIMDGQRSGEQNRTLRSAKPYKQAVRDILSLPNPTTPMATVTGPATATVGTPVTLTVEVTDPDYGDSWTYAWSESSATMNGGTFGDFQAATTTYTPAIAGTVILSLTVADDAQQAVTVTHQVVVTE